MVLKMNLFSKISILILLFGLVRSDDDKLEVIKEEELEKLFQEEKFVITLFGEDAECTGKCESLESTLVSVREELVEGTGGWVIRTHAPTMGSDLGVKGSAILFVREGRPILYTGSATNDEVVLEFILKNKSPLAHNLTDDSFEHETQAGTGATTGDWFVMFIRSDCHECRQLLALFEAVGVNLKGRKNVALVDREFGAVTARRFGVKTFPSFLLFRLGKVYRFDLPIRDIATLTAFAQDGFRNARGEEVPLPKSPFDDITEACADWLKENPGTALMSICGVLLSLAFVILLNRPPPESWIKKNKKKKKN